MHTVNFKVWFQTKHRTSALLVWCANLVECVISSKEEIPDTFVSMASSQ